MGSRSSKTATGGYADEKDSPGLLGRLNAIPRAQAITEGNRKRRASVKLPPKAVRSSQADWPFIEVGSLSALYHAFRNSLVLLMFEKVSHITRRAMK